MHPDRPIRLAASAVALLGAVASTAHAQVSGSWIADSNGNWSAAENWSSNPAFPDAGGIATFGQFLKLSQSLQVTLDLPGISLSGLTFDSPFQYTLNSSDPGNSINLTGPTPTINVIRTNTGSPSLVPAGHSLAVALAGSNGLVKIGPGALTLGASNSYAGGTTISGGVLATTVGDVAFGATGSITLNNATLRAQTLPMGSGRQINLPGEGTIDTRTPITLSGIISGAGTLNKAAADSFLALASANTYTGPTNVRAGTLVLSNNGSIHNTSAILAGGTLVLDNSFTSISRLPSAAPLTFLGSALTIGGNAVSGAQETVGSIGLSGGITMLTLTPVNAQPVLLNSNAMQRVDHGTMFVQGIDLGNVQSRVTLGSPPALIGGGGAAGSTNVSIIPWAWGAGTTAASNNSGNSLMTYGPNGLRPLNVVTEYVSTIPAGVSTNNVRITSTQNLDTASTVNALVSASLTGGPVALTGSGTLTITSGALLNLAGIGTFSPAIKFGSAEGVVTATSLFTLLGPVSGSGGLTKSGLGSLRLRSSTSDYTGTTTILAGDLAFTGNVTPGSPGPLGADASPVVLAPGSSVGGTSGAAFARLWAGGPGTTTFSRDLIVRGNPIATCGLGTDGSFINQTLVMNGNISLQTHLELQGDQVTPLIINGAISGPGYLSDNFAAAQTINGNNTYSGGTEIRDGQWYVGSDTALGSGTIWFATAGGKLAASGATPRTLSNPVAILRPMTINGNAPLTLAGPIDLGGLTVTQTISNTATTTYAGVVSSGGISKAGAGVLALSGNNTYSGGTSVNAGTVIASTNSTALGSGTLAIAAGAVARVNPGMVNAIKLRALQIAAGGTLDLTNNAFINDYTGPVGTLATDTSAMIEDGRIFSSLADAAHVLGYADNATLGLTTFVGTPIDSTSILIRFTVAGDANLDGQVDVTDLGALATNWQTSNVWSGGDFNYDGFVDVTDLGMLATNWQAGSSGPSLAQALASVGLADAAVPESSTVFAVAAIFSLRRRPNRIVPIIS